MGTKLATDCWLESSLDCAFEVAEHDTSNLDGLLLHELMGGVFDLEKLVLAQVLLYDSFARSLRLKDVLVTKGNRNGYLACRCPAQPVFV